MASFLSALLDFVAIYGAIAIIVRILLLFSEIRLYYIPPSEVETADYPLQVLEAILLSENLYNLVKLKILISNDPKIHFLCKNAYPKQVLSENVVYISSKLFEPFYTETDRLNLFYPIVAQIHRYQQNLGQKKPVSYLPLLVLISVLIGAEFMILLQHMLEGKIFLDWDLFFTIIPFIFFLVFYSSLTTLSRTYTFDFYALSYSSTYIDSLTKVWSEYSLFSRIRQSFLLGLFIFNFLPIGLRINILKSRLKKHLDETESLPSKILPSPEIQLDLSEETPYEFKFCPFCGTTLLLNAKFCISCGSAIPEAKPVDKLPTQLNLPSRTPPYGSLLSPDLCPKCHLPLPPKMEDCTFCNTLLRKGPFYFQLSLSTWIMIFCVGFSGGIVYHRYLRSFLDGYVFALVFGFLSLVLLLFAYNLMYFRTSFAFKLAPFRFTILLGVLKLLSLFIFSFLFPFEIDSSLFYAFSAPFLAWICGGLFLEYYWLKKRLKLSFLLQNEIDIEI
jgi:hypothetical protein